MNDAERDAWLREALRHAPDSQALPPRGVSEAILAQARAAAKKEPAVPARGARAARAHPLAVFWDWLARPPVAAGFASVMAATLVGLMWWDRPIDDTLPRRPDAVSERAPAPAPADAAAPTQSAAPLAKNEERTSATRTMPATKERGRAQDQGAGEAAPSGRLAAAGEGAARRDDKVAPSPPSDKHEGADAIGPDSVARAERKARAPAPFAPTENERDALAAKPSPAAKKDEARPPAPAAETRAPSNAAVAQSSVAAEAAAAPAAPPAAARLRVQPEPTPPLARRRADGDDARTTAGGASLDAAKSAPAPVTAAAPAAVPAPGLRSGTLGAVREKQASAFGSAPAAAPAPPAGLDAPAAPMRNEVAAAERQNTFAAAPLAAVLAAIANEPARWARTSASGNVVALDAGWRDWLAQLDAAAAGRWRPLAGASGAADSEREGATTLRLVGAGRASAVVRIDGTAVRIDGPSPGERWQASLPADAAERLRAAAARLPP